MDTVSLSLFCVNTNYCSPSAITTVCSWGLCVCLEHQIKGQIWYLNAIFVKKTPMLCEILYHNNRQIMLKHTDIMVGGKRTGMIFKGSCQRKGISSGVLSQEWMQMIQLYCSQTFIRLDHLISQLKVSDVKIPVLQHTRCIRLCWAFLLVMCTVSRVSREYQFSANSSIMSRRYNQRVPW